MLSFSNGLSDKFFCEETKNRTELRSFCAAMTREFVSQNRMIPGMDKTSHG